MRGEPDGEGQVWPGLVVSIIQIDHKCLPGLCGIDFVTFLSTWIAHPGSAFLKNGVVKIFTIQVSSLSLKSVVNELQI